MCLCVFVCVVCVYCVCVCVCTVCVCVDMYAKDVLMKVYVCIRYVQGFGAQLQAHIKIGSFIRHLSCRENVISVVLCHP